MPYTQRQACKRAKKEEMKNTQFERSSFDLLPKGFSKIASKIIKSKRSEKIKKYKERKIEEVKECKWCKLPLMDKPHIVGRRKVSPFCHPVCGQSYSKHSKKK